jgi:hypothetical protein
MMFWRDGQQVIPLYIGKSSFADVDSIPVEEKVLGD